jgi:excisionase family DNA binding protein
MKAALMTVPEAAQVLGLSAYQVRAEHERGLLPARRSGRLLRFHDDDIAVYLDRIKEDRGAAQSGLTDRSRQRRRTA